MRVTTVDDLILTGLCDLLLGYACHGPFRWTDSASWLGHLVLFLYSSVLRDMRLCCPIDRRPLAGYIDLTSCPSHLLPRSEHFGSAGRCIPTGRGEFGAGTRRGWASKFWRFRHTVEMLVQLECTQFSQFISHSHDIPFQSSNQTAQVEYPELCSTGVHRIFTVFHRERTAPSWYYSPSFSVISLPSCPSVSLLTERVQTSAGKRTRRRERRRRNEGEGVNHHLSKRSLQRSEVYACAPRDDWQGDKQRKAACSNVSAHSNTQSQSLSHSAILNSNSLSLSLPTFFFLLSRCSPLGKAKKSQFLGIKKEKNEKGGEKVFCCCHSCVYWSSCESLSLSLSAVFNLTG